MRVFTLLIFTCITLLNAQSQINPINNPKRSNTDFKLVAYFPVNGKIEDMEEVDLSRLTHVIGAFIQSDINGNLKFPGWKYDPSKTSQEAEEEMLDSLIAKAKRVGTVPMIALGTTYDGWQMTKDPSARSNFISNIKAFIEEKDLGGIDLDLEGWVDNTSSPFYPEPYALLATELRDSLGNDIIITSAVTANEPHVENWTDSFLSVLDWINVMVYDIRVWNEDNIANQSLFSDQVAAAGFWLDRGLTKEQIVFGVPFYSRGWDYDNKKPYAVDVCWAPNHAADSSTWTWSQIGTFSWEMLNKKFSIQANQDSVIVTPEDQMWIDDGWTGYRGTANGILYFNSHETLKSKTLWAKDSGFGGMMIWELTGDIATSDNNSLLRTIANTIEQTDIKNIKSKGNLKSIYQATVAFTNQTMNLSITSGTYYVSIIDIKGREIFKINNNYLNEGEHLFPLNNMNLSQGTYFVKIRSNLSSDNQIIKKFTIMNR